MKKEKMTGLHAAAERQIRGAARHGSRLNRTAQLEHNVNWRKNGVNTAAPKIDLTNITNKDAKRFTFFEKKFIISS
jgi:hypothetical protein